MSFLFARLGRLCAIWGAAVLLASVIALGASANGDSVASFEQAKAMLDQIETAIQHDGLSEEAYADLKSKLAPIRDELRRKIDALVPELDQNVTRLNQLGDAPAPGAAPEDPAITAERSRLTASRGDTEAALKQARLLALRADQISDRINEQRRVLFARELFARTPGLLDPAFWRTTAASASDEVDRIDELLAEWRTDMSGKGGNAGAATALATLIVLVAVAWTVRRWWLRRFVATKVETRFGRSLAALAVLAGHAVPWPLVVFAAVSALANNGLMPARIAEIGFGLAIAVAIACFGRGAALGLFAPGEPGRRQVQWREAEARFLSDHLIWGARLLAIAVFVNVLHKSVSAPISLTVATSALLSLVIGLLVLHLLLRFPHAAPAERSTSLAWMRVLAWIFIATVAVSLVTGYISFAAFLAGRVLVVLALFSALYIALTFIDALFSDVLTGETERGRAVAALFGVSPRTLELVGTLLSALARVMVVLLAFFPVLGRWGTFAADVFGVLQDAASGVRIGGISIPITAILGAIALFIIGILATRGIQRWLERRFLPRTGLDPGLQNSVSALFGYALMIAVISLALSQVGLDLQKIALIAGALSVGIGFGLQSVVSNFVSGLILLAERPIRVGDWVVVKSEEGWVRRISVRATEIETFDRATVIVPNSEFITGVVKNWTHSNTLGRIVVKVGVAYDSDIDKVHDLLMACAHDHPYVLESQRPSVFLVGFGDNALEFELRCIVANVQNALVVKSDLHFAVLRRFRAEGITIPFPQRQVQIASDAGRQGTAAVAETVERV